jgi:hypothetical protein
MGQRSSGQTRLLAQRIGGNGKVNHRTDVLRNGCEEWDPRCQLFLLSGLPRPKGAQEHLSYTCLSTRMSVPHVSKSNHSGYKAGPSVARNSLISQLKDLIVDPLSSTNISCVIVVDALDECVDDQPASAILSVLGRFVKQLPSVKFFITGRPEPRIRTGFRLPLLEPFTQIFLLHEVELSSVDEDIRLYLQEKLTAVAKRRSDFDLRTRGPAIEDLTTLTKKSSGPLHFRIHSRQVHRIGTSRAQRASPAHRYPSRQHRS